jgi:hypothetical protein
VTVGSEHEKAFHGTKVAGTSNFLRREYPTSERNTLGKVSKDNGVQDVFFDKLS